MLWRARIVVAKLAGLCLAPLLIGAFALVFVEESDAKASFQLFAALVLLPLGLCFVIQCGALIYRVLWPAGRQYPNPYRLTRRGRWFLASGLFFLTLALLLQWASLGTLAVLSLALVYLISTWAAVIGARLAHPNSVLTCERQFSPASLTSGDSCTAELFFPQLRIPPLFMLVVEDAYPPRLQTVVRSSLGRKAHHRSGSLRVELARTPRGVFVPPPPVCHYRDLLGLTKITVATQCASPSLRILPTVPSIRRAAPFASRSEQPDLLSQVQRQADDDWFRMREYVPGDDSRRIHWKQSLRHGRLILRQPEAAPETRGRVQLALDTYLSPSFLEDDRLDLPLALHLDRLVAAWLATAKCLQKKGFEVVLKMPGKADVTIPRGPDDLFLSAREAGAEAAWQSSADLAQDPSPSSGIIFSGRLDAWPVQLATNAEWAFLNFTGSNSVPAQRSWLARVFLESPEEAQPPLRSEKRLEQMARMSRRRLEELRRNVPVVEVTWKGKSIAFNPVRESAA